MQEARAAERPKDIRYHFKLTINRLLLDSRLKALLEARPYATILCVVNPDTAPYFERIGGLLH